MSINFISSKDSDETCNMHTKSNNIEIMVGSEIDEIIQELFKSPLQRYQEGLGESMKGGELVLIVLIFQKTSLKRTTSSYIDSPQWPKNEKKKKNNNNKSEK